MGEPTDRPIWRRVVSAPTLLAVVATTVMAAAAAPAAETPAAETSDTNSTAVAGPPETQGVPASDAGPEGVLATEGSLVYEPADRPDGERHINTPRMIETLQELNVNTYAFPLTDRSTNWPDLRDEFLPAAAEAGIDVWVLIYPPSQPVCCSAPFGTDYVRWATEIAEVSLEHPNLIGWTIDDYAYDLSTFTPEYVERMQSAAKGINPSLALLPVVYFAQFTSDFVADHAPLVDGIVFPFWDEPSRNTSWIWSMPYQVGQVAARLDPHDTSLYLMPYAHPLQWALQPPTVDYVREITGRGLDLMESGQLDGVVQYRLPLVPQHDSWQRPQSDNLARTGNGRLSFVVEPETTTSNGMWCGASQTIRPDSDAPRHQVSFWHSNQRNRGNESAYTGHHMKQLLVDGDVVWERDVTADPAGEWRQASVDLTAELEGKTEATLQWRLFERQGVTDYWVDVGVDDIQATGFTVDHAGVEEAAAWTSDLARSGGPMYCSAQVYHQEYGADAFDAVAELFATL